MVDLPNGPRALLRKETYAGLDSMLKMQPSVSGGAGAIKPGRLLAALPAVGATVEQCIEDLSQSCDDRLQ